MLRHFSNNGFILPTVIISSMVMFIVLLSSVSATVATRTALNEQYYYQLARTAAESGLIKAQACLQEGLGQGQEGQPWDNQLVPGVKCDGLANTNICDVDDKTLGCNYVLFDSGQQVRTVFEVKAFKETDLVSNKGDIPSLILSTGTTQLFNESNQTWREYHYHLKADFDINYTILRTY